MDHRMNFLPTAASVGAQAHVNRLITALTRAFSGLVTLTQAQQQVLLARIGVVFAVLAYCFVPVGLVAALVWWLDSVWTLSDDTAFWFLATIALGAASLTPLALLFGVAREFGRQMRIDVAENCRDVDREAWSLLDQRLASYQNELRSTSLRDRNV